ncbi:hypothetical protein DFH29DRAFT_895631 [Suillus ampliporus]|nr:hypothetical protein DFH29DRAFT_895631 [Suillus ampliporus]
MCKYCTTLVRGVYFIEPETFSGASCALGSESVTLPSMTPMGLLEKVPVGGRHECEHLHVLVRRRGQHQRADLHVYHPEPAKRTEVYENTVTPDQWIIVSDGSRAHQSAYSFSFRIMQGYVHGLQHQRSEWQRCVQPNEFVLCDSCRKIVSFAQDLSRPIAVSGQHQSGLYRRFRCDLMLRLRTKGVRLHDYWKVMFSERVFHDQ